MPVKLKLIEPDWTLVIDVFGAVPSTTFHVKLAGVGSSWPRGVSFACTRKVCDWIARPV